MNFQMITYQTKYETGISWVADFEYPTKFLFDPNWGSKIKKFTREMGIFLKFNLVQ